MDVEHNVKRKGVIYSWKNPTFPQCVKIEDVYVASNECLKLAKAKGVFKGKSVNL